MGPTPKGTLDVAEHAVWVRPMAPPSWGGANTVWERLVGVGPPWPPLNPRGFILVSFTGKFTNILGLIG